MSLLPCRTEVCGQCCTTIKEGFKLQYAARWGKKGSRQEGDSNFRREKKKKKRKTNYIDHDLKKKKKKAGPLEQDKDLYCWTLVPFTSSHCLRLTVD